MITGKQICEYQYKKVRIIDIEGNAFEGELLGPYGEFDTDSGKEEISLRLENHILDIPIDEVESMELLE